MTPWKRDDDEFWEMWAKTIKQNKDTLIQPHNSQVVKFSRKVEHDDEDSNIDIAHKVWSLVNNEVDYKLEPYRKMPSEIIFEGNGGCEGMSFLVASMLPNLGVMNSYIEGGILHFNDGRSEQHTWNVVDDQIIDATGDQKDVIDLEYDTKARIGIVANKEVTVNKNDKN